MTRLSQEYHDLLLRHPSSDDDETHFDDLLQRVLSILAELPDISVNDLQMRHLPNATDDDETKASDDTTLVLNFLQDTATVLNNPERSFPSTEYSFYPASEIWAKCLILVSNIANNTSATALHATAMSSYYFSDSSPEGNSDGYSIFRMLCILLSCRALQNLLSLEACPSWKRSQSLLFETLRLYDQFQKCQIHQRLFTVELWCEHVMPATAAWHRYLWQRYHCRPEPQWQWYMAYESVGVAVTSHLMVQWQPQYFHADRYKSSLTSLSMSLYQLVLIDQYDWLCDHAWRAYIEQHDHLLIASYKKAIQNGIEPTTSQALTYFTTDFDSDEDEDENRRDFLCGISSTWSDLGVALIVSTLWDIRPKVWTIAYQWRLFFPHVNVLLLAEVMNEEEEIESLEFLRLRASIILHGYCLLQQLLSQTTTWSLSIAEDEDSPDHPFRTCQLLLNHMMEASNSNSRNMQHLPNAVRIYQILKQLLTRYRPVDQVETIKRLVENCPYPGLKPKLVDLLRIMVEWKNARDAESKVWRFVEQQFLLPIENLLRGWSTRDFMTSAVLGTLIDETEYFAAHLGLIHVWIICRRNIPSDLNACRIQVMGIHSNLQGLLTQHVSSKNSQSSSSEELNRLELLENSLQRTLDVMHEL